MGQPFAKTLYLTVWIPRLDCMTTVVYLSMYCVPGLLVVLVPVFLIPLSQEVLYHLLVDVLIEVHISYFPKIFWQL